MILKTLFLCKKTRELREDRLSLTKCFKLNSPNENRVMQADYVTRTNQLMCLILEEYEVDLTYFTKTVLVVTEVIDIQSL